MANKRRQMAPLLSVFLRALGKHFPKTKKTKKRSGGPTSPLRRRSEN